MIINSLAWKFVPTEDHKDSRNNHWLWKLNNWVSGHYTLWWAKEGHKLIESKKGKADPTS